MLTVFLRENFFTKKIHTLLFKENGTVKCVIGFNLISLSTVRKWFYCAARKQEYEYMKYFNSTI